MVRLQANFRWGEYSMGGGKRQNSHYRTKIRVLEVHRNFLVDIIHLIISLIYKKDEKNKEKTNLQP